MRRLASAAAEKKQQADYPGAPSSDPPRRRRAPSDAAERRRGHRKLLRGEHIMGLDDPGRIVRKRNWIVSKRRIRRRHGELISGKYIVCRLLPGSVGHGHREHDCRTLRGP
jgi:hypothetical protein